MERRKPIQTPLVLPPTAGGTRWLDKEGMASRQVGFLHDFYAVLRKTTDAFMADHTMKSHRVSFIDSFTVEDL